MLSLLAVVRHGSVLAINLLKRSTRLCERTRIPRGGAGGARKAEESSSGCHGGASQATTAHKTRSRSFPPSASSTQRLQHAARSAPLPAGRITSHPCPTTSITPRQIFFTVTGLRTWRKKKIKKKFKLFLLHRLPPDTHNAADNEVKSPHRDAPRPRSADAAPAEPPAAGTGSPTQRLQSDTDAAPRPPPPPGSAGRARPSRPGRCQVTAEKRFTGLEVRNARLVFRSDPHSYICKAKGGREIKGWSVPGRRPRLPPCGGRAGWRSPRRGRAE